MELKSSIVKNVTSGWVERIISIGSVLVITPILISHLGKEQYGIWIAIGQGAGLLILLDFGVSSSISRFVSRNLALRNNDENDRVISTAMIILVIGCFFILLITVGLSPIVPSLFKINENYNEIAILVFILTGLNVALIFPFRVGRGLLQGINRYDIISLYTLVINILRVIIIVVIFESGMGDLLVLAIITVLLGLCLESAFFISGRKKYSDLKIKLSVVTSRNFAELFSLGGSALVQTISSTLNRRFQILAVSIVLGVSVTPLYSIPLSLFLYIGPFINRLGATFTPIASSMDAKGEEDRLKSLNILGVRYGLVISIPLCIFLFFFGEDILKLWLGSTGLVAADFEIMEECFCIISFPFAFGAPQIASRSLLSATGKHWLVSWGFFSSSVAGLAVSIILMKYTELGILGAAIGFATTYVLTGILLYPCFICRRLDMSKSIYFKKAYFAPVWSAILLILLSLALNELLIGMNIYILVFKIGLFSIAAALIGIYVGLLSQHRKYLFNSLKIYFFHTSV
jgi:O-antigen/teichoic acid export membrane protein